MNKVKKLPEEVFSKIAAGEVIEKPSNALKELIENSLDAQATIINIRILESGIKLIEVRDNGIGISKEDLPLVIERYTTSKISTEKDLLNIATFGFRGEALYAISKISNIEIISKTENQDSAYVLKASEGKIIKLEPANFNLKTGTIIKVANLFFNTPVRKNFISSEKIEIFHIINTFKHFAAINNNVLFTLHIDDKLKYNLIPTKLDSRIKELFKIDNLAIEELTHEDYHITLALSKNYKYQEKITSKNNFFTYVNKRIVLMHDLDKIVINTFKEVLGERGKIEGVILINCPPNEVDSNIHPRKLEVRFLKPIFVKNLLQKTIKNFINNHLISKISILPTQQNPPTQSPTNWYKTINILQKLEEITHPQKPQIDNTLTFQNKQISNQINNIPVIEKHPQIPEEIHQEKPKILHYWDNCFFLLIYNNSFYIVDQHNASEKIIYSKLLNKYQNKIQIETQKLLIPIKIYLETSSLSQSFFEFIEKVGFQYTISEESLDITAYPLGLNQIKESIMFIIDQIENGTLDDEEFIKEILSQIACKSAIKKGQKLTNQELERLFLDLISIEKLNPYFCPHGRNVMIEISFHDINKMFERKL